jgi:aflatoxin B1 aldehyde reductase
MVSKFFGKLDLHGSFVDTKYFAFVFIKRQVIDVILSLYRINPAEPGAFAPDKLRATFQDSLKALGPQKIRVLYLHSPDRSDKRVPFEDTLRVINEFHQSGHM